jgi:hypothetical protein
MKSSYHATFDLPKNQLLLTFSADHSKELMYNDEGMMEPHDIMYQANFIEDRKAAIAQLMKVLLILSWIVAIYSKTTSPMLLHTFVADFLAGVFLWLVPAEEGGTGEGDV